MKFAYALILLAVLLSGCTEKQTMKIGVIAPLTGEGANLGIPLVNGMELALDELENREIVLVVEDSMLDGKASADAAHRLLNIHDVDLVSVLFHPPALAVKPILEERGTPWIYEAYTRSLLESPHVFKSNFDALEGCEELLRYAKEHGVYERLGILMARAEYSELCLEGLRRVEPSIKEYWYQFGETDFRTLLAKAEQDGVDTLMTAGFGFEYTSIFRQLSELGYPLKVICATRSECIHEDVVRSADSAILEGTLSIDFIPLGLEETEFGRKYSARYPNPTPTAYAYGAVGYDQIMIMAKALEACPEAGQDCIVEALEGVEGYDSVLGSTGFEDHVLQIETGIYEFRGGEWVAVE